MIYEVVYDGGNPFPPDLIWLGGALLFVLAVSAFLFSKGGGAWLVGIVLGVFFTAFYGLFVAGPYEAMRADILAGHCRSVSGVVQNFHAEAADGKGPAESFDVAGTHFEYRQFIMTPGYHRSVSHGAPPLVGRNVRICALGGAIGRLEIAHPG